MSTETQKVDVDAEYFVERENPSLGDGYFVKQRNVGTVCYCFDDSGSEAREIAKMLNDRDAVANLIEKATLAEQSIRSLAGTGLLMDVAHTGRADDLRTALARVGGAK